MHPLLAWFRRLMGVGGGHPVPRPLSPPHPPSPSPPPLLLYISTPTTPQPDLVAIRDKLLDYHNRTRARYHVGPLVENPHLGESAQRHALLMASRGELSYRFPDEAHLFLREWQAGYDSVTGGENIAAGQRDPAEAFATWQADDPCLENIIQPSYKDLGVGVVRGGDGHLYWCVDFGSSRGAVAQSQRWSRPILPAHLDRCDDRRCRRSV